MNRVLVAEPVRHSLEAAKVFGEITFIAPERRLNVYDPKSFKRDIMDALEALDFDPSHDKICLTGSVTTVALFLAAVVEEWEGVHVLIFDPKTSMYRERIVGASEQNGEVPTVLGSCPRTP